ncbi:hypothetical protein AK812_SmicGene37558 [Symbiodinium microadriaticum]|uniref:CCHC-type domain-containing protein n=1 Tax=Symbiodinium microadriaticum TaxID=2951 RepID=A0A1Q9CFY2_SYMMI|nr:hypothetical protein AK812_SmicGene37558 [Symbiodinium microadriaticum]
MSNDGTASDPVPVREASCGGPPPGFEDAQPSTAPDAPPDTSLGRADKTPATDYASKGDVDKRDSFADQWCDSGWSRWDDRGSQSWGADWSQRGQQWETDRATGWGRRTSWEITTADTGGGTERKTKPKDDPWANGQDPWTRGNYEDTRHRGRDWQGSHGDPWADGRVGKGQGSDSGDRGPGSWTGSSTFEDSGVAWNGWAHFGNGGFQGGGDDRQTQRSNGRATERLSVPTFSGEDSDDIGSSARSYLRQIEAWRRMTYLPVAQQGLVLYQNLSGKAWIAAEELSVPKLGSESGVGYFVSWINSRFLDLEIARIGKAFSDFFRRLKRRSGQSIREYNSEYDRLHARLREVGCSLPQECAAWLYIDRLQLEEAQELNLLASVGNEYNLHRLQQAAVLHDRGHRKPWETSRTRKPYSAHLTNASEDNDYDESRAPREDESDLEDGVPEEVAIAYATYQSAKERYRDQAKARGYQGGRDNGQSSTKDFAKKAELTKDEKVKLMKSRSFCSSCGKKGHWHRDPECPNNAGGGGTRGIKEIDVCHHVAAEVFSLKHEGSSLLGITDTACAKAVAGTMWLQQYSDALEKIHQRPELVRESEAFRFGTGKVHHSSFHVVVCFRMGERTVEMRTSIINGDVPLLMSKVALAQLGMIYDVAKNKADFTCVGLRSFDLVTTSSGHPAIPIVPTKPAEGPERLVIGETGTQTGSQYTAFAVSVVHEKAPPFKIFYDKKLAPEIKEMLTQDYRRFLL